MSVVHVIALMTGGRSSLSSDTPLPTNPYPVYGALYNTSSWGGTSDFITRGGATVALSGTKLLVGGGTDTFDRTVEQIQVSGVEKFIITSQFRIVNAPSGSSNGIGFGIRSVNTFGSPSLVGRLDLRSGSGGTIGKLMINVGESTPFTQVGISSGTLVYSQNDIIEVILDYSFATVNVSARNVTTGAAAITATYTYGVVSPFVPNAGRFSIYSFGDSYEIQSLTITSNEIKNAELMVIGDSKTQLYSASTLTNRYPTKLNLLYPYTIVNAGGYDRTTEVLSKISQIISFAPKKIVLNIGSNDKRTSVPLATWQTNYSNIVTQLVNAGIDVYHLLQFNENSFTFTDYNSYITTNYSSNKIIDAGTIHIAADGVHPNDMGMEQIKYAVFDKLKVTSLNLTNARIICDGNSLTQGYLSTNPAVNSYPAVLDASAQMTAANVTVYNFGVSSQQTSEMAADAATQIDTLYNPSVVNIVCAWEGGNDIYFNGNATTAHTNYKNYMLARKAVGFKTLAFTCPPRNQTTTFGDSSDSYNAKLVTFNNLVKAEWQTYADGLVDVAADARFVGYSNIYYNADNVHYTDAGYAAVAQMVKAIINTL